MTALSTVDASRLLVTATRRRYIYSPSYDLSLITPFKVKFCARAGSCAISARAMIILFMRLYVAFEVQSYIKAGDLLMLHS